MAPVFGNNPSSPIPLIASSGSIGLRAGKEVFNAEFVSLFDKQVKLSQEARLQKVEKLTNDQKIKLSHLSERLDLVHQSAHKLILLQKDKTILPDDERIQLLMEEIRQFEDSIYQQFTPFLLLPKTALEEPLEIHVTHYIESVLNAFVNRIYYENEVTANINSELHNILSLFEFPPSQVVKIEYPENETHNGGKSTCVIHLQNANGSARLVYKPRNAKVDDLVIATFQRINGLELLSDKSASPDLPTYRIFHCQDKDFTVWEYISDTSLRKNQVSNPQSLGSFISNMTPDVQVPAVRMDEILSFLHVGDLHGENIMVRKRTGSPQEFVPIDLEVIYFPEDMEQPTKTELGTQNIKKELIGKGLYKGLTNAEMSIIREMRGGFFRHISRFVPLGTYNLVKKLTSLYNYTIISDLFKNAIQESGFIFEGEIDRLLKENILLDYLNNDVPYLSQKEGKLYYGNASKNVCLAQRGG